MVDKLIHNMIGEGMKLQLHLNNKAGTRFKETCLVRIMLKFLWPTSGNILHYFIFNHKIRAISGPGLTHWLGVIFLK